MVRRWRPIWQYVSLFCDDFLSVKDIAAGHSNDRETICKTKALKIASRFNRTDRDGTMDAWVKIHKDEYKKGKKHNDKIQKELGFSRTTRDMRLYRLKNKLKGATL